MFAKFSLNAISLAAAMTTAWVVGAAAHAQTAPPTLNQSGDEGVPALGGNAITPERRDAAKAGKTAN